MKGALFYTGKYGSTRQYAEWISEATHLPIFNLNNEKPDPDYFDFLVLGSSIIIMKPTIAKWIKKHWNELRNKPVILFTVSGTETDNPELKHWLKDNLPVGFMDGLKFVPLRGRLNIKELPWWVRLMLKLGASREEDPQVKQRMTQGFNYMDRPSISPIVEWVNTMQMQKNEADLQMNYER